MFCTNCGHPLLDDDIYCPNCGQKIDRDEPDAYYNAERQPREEYNYYRNSNEQYSDPGRHEDKGSFDKYVEMAAGGIGLTWLVVFLLDLLRRIVWGINGILPYIGPAYGLFSGISTALYYITSAFIWLIIIGAFAVIGGLIYKLTQKRPGESNQMILAGIIDAAIVLAVGILYKAPFYLGTAYALSRTLIYIGGIASLVIGIDLFIKVFIERDGLSGSFSLSDDIALIKSKFAKADTSDTSHYTDVNIPRYEMTEQHEAKDSYFDGSGTDLFIKRLLLALISLVTCGIGAPFMLANIEKWSKEHTVIEGRRLTFNGTGGQLFVKTLIWMLLSTVTCGIYALFIQTEYCKWVLKHTAYEGTQPVNEEFPESFFDGTVGESIGNQILNYLICVFTCGLGLPWGRTMIVRWEKKGSVISRDRLFYDGDGSGMFKEYLIVWLLTLVTCGIYSPWGAVRLEKYIINHTHIDSRWRY